MFEQIAYVLEINPGGISVQICLKGGHCVGAGCRPPDGSQETLGSSMGGAREALGRPLRGSRRLLGASREAPGRLLGATKRNPETSEEPKEGPGPHGTPKNPPRTPQKPSLESRVRADLRPRRTQEGASSTTGALKGVFKKGARRLDGKHIFDDSMLLHRPERCFGQASASTERCKMPFSKQGSRHTGRNLANSKNGTPPPPPFPPSPPPRSCPR